MTLRKVLFIICLASSVLCMAAGYGIAGKWIGALTAILMVPGWLFARKSPDPWLPPICLFVSVGLAVAGRLVGAISLLMVFGSAFALAAWDLIYLDAALKSNSYGEQTRRYENKHIQSLVLALGSGLFAVYLGRLIDFRFPLIVLMLLISFILLALDRIWGYIKK